MQRGFSLSPFCLYSWLSLLLFWITKSLIFLSFLLLSILPLTSYCNKAADRIIQVGLTYYNTQYHIHAHTLSAVNWGQYQGTKQQGHTSSDVYTTITSIQRVNTVGVPEVKVKWLQSVSLHTVCLLSKEPLKTTQYHIDEVKAEVNLTCLYCWM